MLLKFPSTRFLGTAVDAFNNKNSCPDLNRVDSSHCLTLLVSLSLKSWSWNINLHDWQKGWKLYVIALFLIICFEMWFDFFFSWICTQWTHHCNDVPYSNLKYYGINRNMIIIILYGQMIGSTLFCFFLS